MKQVASGWSGLLLLALAWGLSCSTEAPQGVSSESTAVSTVAADASSTGDATASAATGQGAAGGGLGAGGSGGQASGGGDAGGSSMTVSGSGGQGGMCVPGTGPCMDLSSCDYGRCKKFLGWGFNGQDCVTYSGCSCAPNCAGFHASLSACIQDCASYCDTNAFLGHVLGPKGWGAGTHCDQVTVCVDGSSQDQVTALFPNASCGASGVTCPASQTACVLAYAGKVSAQQYANYCSLTLVQEVGNLYCSLFP